MNPVSFPRLTLVELRKMVDTRAGFWLQLIVAVITLAAIVILFCIVADDRRADLPRPVRGRDHARERSCCRSSASCSSARSGRSARR